MRALRREAGMMGRGTLLSTVVLLLVAHLAGTASADKPGYGRPPSFDLVANVRGGVRASAGAGDLAAGVYDQATLGVLRHMPCGSPTTATEMGSSAAGASHRTRAKHPAQPDWRGR